MELGCDIGEPLQGMGAKPVLDLGEREMGEIAEQVELRLRPLARLLRYHAKRPEDVAAAILYLADANNSGFVNGVCLPVDGGWTADASWESLRLSQR